MTWLERLREAARSAARQAGESTERLAEQLAARTDSALGQTAGELLAERRWKQADALAKEGLDAARAEQVTALLKPVAEVDSNFAAPIHFLLGQAYEALDATEDAEHHYEEADYLLRDVAWAQTATPTLVEQLGQVPDELRAEVLCSLAALALRREECGACRRFCDDAIACDRRRLTPYYLRGCAMLASGEPEEQVVDLWLRAYRAGGPASRDTVLGWVAEHLPAHTSWFERLAV